VLLGLSAPVEQMIEGFRSAAQSTTCKGFTVGRTIFHEPSQAWLAGEIGDDELIARVRRTFETLIQSWRDSRVVAGAGGTSNAASPRNVHQEQAA
jgi:5-dehydro-2-deoxygluconokinase